MFPNTFEYFFDFYEIVRLRWDPRRLGKRLLLEVAAFIWLVIKLPQEYIIHVAQVSAIEWIKVNIFGVEIAASWGQGIANRPLASVALIALAAAAPVLAARWLLTHRLPTADHRPRLEADPIPDDVAQRGARVANALPRLSPTDPALIEKIVLVSLVTVVFAEVLPGVEAGALAVAVGVALVIVANIALSTWLARSGRTWRSFGRESVALTVTNTGLIVLYTVLLPTWYGAINIWDALFFGLLVTLLVTVYDRYLPIHRARFGKEA